MLAINSLVDRQELIEEIYAELEALLLGPRKKFEDPEEEEIESTDEENSFEVYDEENGQKRKQRREPKTYSELAIFPRSPKEWSNLTPEEVSGFKSKLLELLEQKRLLLIQGINDIDRIVAENAVD